MNMLLKWGHVINSVPGDPARCPIALCMTEALGVPCRVYRSKAVVEYPDGPRTITLPQELKELVRRIDHGDKIEAFPKSTHKWITDLAKGDKLNEGSLIGFIELYIPNWKKGTAHATSELKKVTSASGHAVLRRTLQEVG